MGKVFQHHVYDIDVNEICRNFLQVINSSDYEKTWKGLSKKEFIERQTMLLSQFRDSMGINSQENNYALLPYIINPDNKQYWFFLALKLIISENYKIRRILKHHLKKFNASEITEEYSFPQLIEFRVVGAVDNNSPIKDQAKLIEIVSWIERQEEPVCKYDESLKGPDGFKNKPNKDNPKKVPADESEKIFNKKLTAIIAEFEKLLKTKTTSEGQWGKFLHKNLSLLGDYERAIPNLNVVLGGTRKADFGLVTNSGELHILEIKRPSTPLLAKKPDGGEGGNYYFHTAAVKAIAQAEKYRFNAGRKGDALEKDILIQKGITVRVTSLTTILLIGRSSQLETRHKKDDFEILNGSLRNVQIKLYDALLTELKNMKSNIQSKGAR